MLTKTWRLFVPNLPINIKIGLQRFTGAHLDFWSHCNPGIIRSGNPKLGRLTDDKMVEFRKERTGRRIQREVNGLTDTKYITHFIYLYKTSFKLHAER